MNWTTTRDLVVAFWLGFIPAALAAYPIWKALLLLKSRQTVSQYAPEGHQLKQGTPTMGGLIIVFGALVALVMASMTLSHDVQAQVRGQSHVLSGALVLLLGFSIIGFVDDFVVPKLIKGTRGLGWKQKIVMQIVVAVLAAWMVNRGTGAAGEGSSLLSMAGTVFLILFFSNAYNFSDGLDGLAGSLLLGLAAGLVPIVLIVGADPALAVVVVALVGALLPFLYLNAPPARVFMGDVGSLPIGAVLGYVIGSLGTASHYVHGIAGQSATGEVFSYATHEVRTAPLILALFVLSLMMVAELVPVPLQILSVKVRKKKLFPYTPIHHAFEKAGWKETHVVAMFALLQLLFSALAISLALFAAPSMLGSRP